jgi:hypothetical protein
MLDPLPVPSASDWNGLTACAVKQTVADLDSIVNSIGGGGIVDFPETETHKGHAVARVELDSR